MKSLEASPEAKPNVILLALEFVGEKFCKTIVLGSYLLRNARILNVVFEVMLSERVAGGEIGPTLGGALVGSEPSVVYHMSAATVWQSIVNPAALSPKITGLAALKMKRAWMIELLGRPNWKLMALTVVSGCRAITEGGTWSGNSPS